MKHFLYITLFLLPLTLFGQSEKVFVITDSTVTERWVNLGKWRYQKGDMMAWANPDFDDSSWRQLSYYNLNMPDGENAITDRGEIVWFRKRIKADSSLTKAVVLNISQLGASEIYLDGKLVHQLGKVSADLDKVDYHNPYSQILQLPLEKGKEQILAVRYVNAQYKFPIYTGTNGFLYLSVSSLSNANSSDVIKNNRIAANEQYVKNLYSVLGQALIVFIIFISFYFFFPTEKINGYFAISMLLLLFFILGIIFEIESTGVVFWITFLYDTSVVFSWVIFLYCIYKIMGRPLDVVYKTLSFAGLLAIGCFFLYDPNVIAPTWVLLMYGAIIRIAVKSWKSNRVASLLFTSSSIIALSYWVINVLNRIDIIELYLGNFAPFAFMLSPIVLAIYLGYAFGKRSEQLRLNLERIQKLSIEKEAILSTQNETLEKQVKERTFELNQSLENLKATQSQLIQSEKMASLGELTAGIAHEIQNPLNFVNNFSEVSNELIKEIQEERGKKKEERDEALTDEILVDIEQNLEKINHHGKRAGDIVKGMLQHSRVGSDKKEPTDINALADEYLRLAYHGLRAKDKSFNADFKTDLAPDLPKVNVVPQDIGRVLLNLINNAFYAVKEVDNPTVIITSKVIPLPGGARGGSEVVEITVKDNGSGIPEHIKEKIFQPFFTTKPTGSGTGLGLSLSYDILKAHGGSLEVISADGRGSEFSIQLPFKAS